MKEIESFLNIGEEIKWKYQKTKSLLKNTLLLFLLGVVIILINSIILTTILLVFEFKGKEQYIALFVSFFFLYFIGISFISVFYIKYNNYVRNFGLTYRELTNYRETYALTNKRWIQKTPYFFNFDYSNYSKNRVERIHDIIFVNLEEVQEIFINEHEDSGIELFLINDEDEQQYFCFGGKLPIKELQKVKNIVSQSILFEKKEQVFQGTRYHR